MTLEEASGILPPIARKVIPITESLMPNVPPANENIKIVKDYYVTVQYLDRNSDQRIRYTMHNTVQEFKSTPRLSYVPTSDFLSTGRTNFNSPHSLTR